jgi:hypothetical protein
MWIPYPWVKSCEIAPLSRDTMSPLDERKRAREQLRLPWIGPT